MALQLPGIQYLRGYDRPDIMGEFARGYQFGGGIADERDAQGALGDYVRSLYMGAAPQAKAPPGLINGSFDAVAKATDPTLDAYFSSIRAAESGGNDAAKNPNSSATGRYQFTEPTWMSLAQQHPELGLTPEGRLDPAQQERAIKAFTNDNIGVLRGKGLGVNPGNLYAAHFLGAGGATDVLGLPDETPMVAAVSPEVIQANPFLQDMTVGDFRQWTAQKASNGSGGYRAPMDLGMEQGPQTASAAPANGLPPREVMARLFANPVTREFAQQLVQLDKSGQKLINAGGGSIYDPNTGEWLKDPNATDKPPTVVELFDEATGQPYKATWDASTGKFERVGGNKAATNGLTVTTNPDGTTTVTQGGTKPLTEGQSKDTVFSTRAEGALPLIDQYGDALLDPVQHAMGADPTGLVRGRQSPEFQQAWQAGREFLQAILRKDTGAAITPQETEEYGKVYLPSPGDTPEVLEQKRVSRARAVAAIEAGLPPQAILAKEKALLESGSPQPVGVEVPEPGTEMDGYRFKGGDPSDESNWEPL